MYFMCVGSLFCGAVLCVGSSFAIISLRKRESWLRYFNSVLAVVSLSVYGLSSSRCHKLTCFLVLIWRLVLLGHGTDGQEHARIQKVKRGSGQPPP